MCVVDEVLEFTLLEDEFWSELSWQISKLFRTEVIHSESKFKSSRDILRW
jgi:hypothetical protein